MGIDDKRPLSDYESSQNKAVTIFAPQILGLVTLPRICSVPGERFDALMRRAFSRKSPFKTGFYVSIRLSPRNRVPPTVSAKA